MYWRRVNNLLRAGTFYELISWSPCHAKKLLKGWVKLKTKLKPKHNKQLCWYWHHQLYQKPRWFWYFGWRRTKINVCPPTRHRRPSFIIWWLIPCCIHGHRSCLGRVMTTQGIKNSPLTFVFISSEELWVNLTSDVFGENWCYDLKDHWFILRLYHIL